MNSYLPADAPTRPHQAPATDLLRVAAAVSLLGLGLIHLVDLPDTMSRSGLDGAAYLVLIVSTVLVATALLIVNSWQLWVLAALLGTGTFVIYALSRTVGIPGDSADIGNWSDPLGMASNFVEGVITVYAVTGMVLQRVGRPHLPYPTRPLTFTLGITSRRSPVTETAGATDRP